MRLIRCFAVSALIFFTEEVDAFSTLHRSSSNAFSPREGPGFVVRLSRTSRAFSSSSSLMLRAASETEDGDGSAPSNSSSPSGESRRSQQRTKLHMSDSSAEGAAAALTQELQDRRQLTKRLDTIVFANAAVLGVVAFAALYQLLHVDAEALLALWEYDLGRTTSAEVTKVAVAIDLLARLPMDALHSYEALVPTNPVFYKACTSGVAYALGDLISQIYQGRTLQTLDLPRSARSGAAGFIGHGPLCHYWLMTMENYLDFDGAWWATGIKVTADLTVWSVFLNAAYSFIIGSLALRPPQDVWKDVKATSWPALRSAWRFWPFVHTISFSHAVPLDLKLLWVDVMEVIWVTILSKVANEDKNAKMKENPQVEVLDVVEPFDVEPALEIELTREVELDPATGGNLSFELPKKVLGACWPLIVMWPVLFAGYQIERALGLVV